MKKTHYIKIHVEYENSLTDGSKTFEIRLNDREYKKGDTVVMLPVGPNGKRMTSGLLFDAEIGFITDYQQKKGYVVFSLLKVRAMALSDFTNDDDEEA